MDIEARERLVGRLRAFMARTVANGCTEEEELAAARQVAKTMEQLGDTPSGKPDLSWAQAERQSGDYQALLERNTIESLFRAAILELALSHINTVAPPRPKSAAQPVLWVNTMELLEPHLSMMLNAGATRLSRDVLWRSLEELIQDGQLPEKLAIPRE
jgi:hypothetical protein